MHKSFYESVSEYLSTFSEDVYICSLNGAILASRQGEDRGINNIFDILSQADIREINERVSFVDMRSLLLFDSLLGPFLLEISLAARYGVLIVVFPYLSKNELLCLC